MESSLKQKLTKIRHDTGLGLKLSRKKARYDLVKKVAKGTVLVGAGFLFGRFSKKKGY